jgi:hypothetical protein
LRNTGRFASRELVEEKKKKKWKAEITETEQQRMTFSWKVS